MKVRNLSRRNQGLVALHPGNGGVPERAVVPAGATLAMKDSTWKKFSRSASPLLNAGILEMVEAVVSNLTEDQIRAVIKDKAGVIVSPHKDKQQLQDLAEALGVELEVVAEVTKKTTKPAETDSKVEV